MEKLYSKFLSITLLLFLAMHASAQNFTLEFVPPKELSITNFYLDRNIDNELVRDTGKLEGGKVVFKSRTIHPMHGRLSLWLAPEGDNRSQVRFLDVIIEPNAHIKVDASNGLASPIYSGTKNQVDFYNYKSALVPFHKRATEKWNEAFTASKEGDKEKETILKNEARALKLEAQKTQEDFMEKNSTSLVTALLLSDYVTPVWVNLSKAEKYYNNLTPALKALPQMVEFARELKKALLMDIGKNFPEISLPDSTGKMIALSSLRGKHVFVDFWASWCTPCRAESPALVAAYNKFNKKGFEIFSVSFDEKKNAWLKAVAKDGYTWTNVVDSTGMGPQGALSSRLNIMAIPRNFLLNKEGKVVAVNLRGEELDKKLQEIL